MIVNILVSSGVIISILYLYRNIAVNKFIGMLIDSDYEYAMKALDDDKPTENIYGLIHDNVSYEKMFFQLWHRLTVEYWEEYLNKRGVK